MFNFCSMEQDILSIPSSRDKATSAVNYEMFAHKQKVRRVLNFIQSCLSIPLFH